MRSTSLTTSSFGVSAAGMSRKGFALAVNPALDTLRQALHTGQFGVSWVLTSYLLSSAVLTPGSVVAALAHGLPVMAVGRVRFETLNQAVNGDLVIAGQAPRPRLARKAARAGQESRCLRDPRGQVAAWRDYTNPQKPASSWACSRRTTGRMHP